MLLLGCLVGVRNAGWEMQERGSGTESVRRKEKMERD